MLRQGYEEVLGTRGGVNRSGVNRGRVCGTENIGCFVKKKRQGDFQGTWKLGKMRKGASCKVMERSS